MILILLCIPIITSLLLWFVFKNKISIQLSSICTVIILGYILIHTYIIKQNLTNDTEWWGNYITRVNYYDDWDEEVPCRHPIYCTETYTYECGDGKTSRTCTGTRTYVCGYEHPYDVDYHPEYWTKEFDNSEEYNISASEYYKYASKWGNEFYKEELNRDYHSNDGDDKVCDWNNDPLTSEAIITEHTYENRIQASHSIFKAEKIDTSEVKSYKLFEYPECINGKQNCLLGLKGSKETNKLLEYINGYYGSRKQFKLFICCWENQSEITAEKQHSYWDNLNKNEFLVCLGLDKNKNITWCKTYSWMDKPTLSVKTERYFKNNNKLNLKEFLNWLPNKIENNWSRKQFKDFKYIKVDITLSQYLIIFFIVVVLSIIKFIIISSYLKNQKYGYL